MQIKISYNLISQPFKLFRSSRQGLPLSPLLFVIAMELLAIAIRSHPSICGIRTGDLEHHITLYADDTIMFLSDLGKSVPSHLKLISQFGSFPGFKVNKDKYKSSVMFLNEQERRKPLIPTHL